MAAHHVSVLNPGPWRALGQLIGRIFLTLFNGAQSVSVKTLEYITRQMKERKAVKSLGESLPCVCFGKVQWGSVWVCVYRLKCAIDSERERRVSVCGEHL